MATSTEVTDAADPRRLPGAWGVLDARTTKYALPMPLWHRVIEETQNPAIMAMIKETRASGRVVPTTIMHDGLPWTTPNWPLNANKAPFVPPDWRLKVTLDMPWLTPEDIERSVRRGYIQRAGKALHERLRAWRTIVKSGEEVLFQLEEK